MIARLTVVIAAVGLATLGLVGLGAWIGGLH